MQRLYLFSEKIYVGQNVLVKSSEYVEISTLNGVISSLETVCLEEGIMKHVICPICGSVCTKHGKTNAGTQRWFCKGCNLAFSPKINNEAKQLKVFLKWLFSRQTQSDLPGEGRTFRRKTSKFWDIWTLPPVIGSPRDVLYLDGIYLARKACVLICRDEKHVLGWYLCRYEHAGAWSTLMSRIAEPKVVVSDGGTGFAKALRKTWPHARHQRCLFHVFSQVKRYTTSRPKTAAGVELYGLAKELLHLETKVEADEWTERFIHWMSRYNRFLSQLSYDEFGNSRPTHERLIKAQRSLVKLLKEGTMFTYLDGSLQAEIGKVPSTNNRIEGGTNAGLREMLRNHRGLSVERRIKAVFWWCYMHSPRPLSASEILKTMPTDQSIADLYKRMTIQEQRADTIPMWGDAIVWGELHRSTEYPVYWD